MRAPHFQWRLRRARTAVVVLAVVAAPLAAASAAAPHAAAADYLRLGQLERAGLHAR